MRISKIIHQTGPSVDFSENMAMFRKELIQLHPHWQYCFYNDIDCRHVISAHFPSFLSLYDSFSLPIQKADFFRWAAIYQFGDFYTRCSSFL